MKQLAILMLALFFIACKKDDNTNKISEQTENNNNNEITLTTLSEGDYSGLSGESFNLIIQTQQELDSIWTIIYANTLPSTDSPEVDFDKELVLIAFMGTFPTGGYSIKITEVKLEDGVYNYNILTSSPDTNSVVTNAFTAPYHLVRFSR